MRTLLAALLFLSTSVAVLFCEFSDAAAAQNQTCNHFSEDYNALGCFFAAGSSSGRGSGGVGSSDGYQCPGGSQASCNTLEVEERVPVGLWHVQRRHAMGPAGAVDQDVDRAERGRGLGVQALEGRTVGHVRGPCAGCADLGPRSRRRYAPQD